MFIQHSRVLDVGGVAGPGGHSRWRSDELQAYVPAREALETLTDVAQLEIQRHRRRLLSSDEEPPGSITPARDAKAGSAAQIVQERLVEGMSVGIDDHGRRPCIRLDRVRPRLGAATPGLRPAGCIEAAQRSRRWVSCATCFLLKALASPASSRINRGRIRSTSRRPSGVSRTRSPRPSWGSGPRTTKPSASSRSRRLVSPAPLSSSDRAIWRGGSASAPPVRRSTVRTSNIPRLMPYSAISRSMRGVVSRYTCASATKAPSSPRSSPGRARDHCASTSEIASGRRSDFRSGIALRAIGHGLLWLTAHRSFDGEQYSLPSNDRLENPNYPCDTDPGLLTSRVSPEGEMP